MTRNDTRIIHTDGLEEGIRCAMCTNPMANNRGCDGGCDINESMYKRVLDVIKKNILEQEPCEDCISRQAVIDTLDRMDKVLDEDRTVKNYKELLKECYEVLPSVNPQKIGHWIKLTDYHFSNISYMGECSECGDTVLIYEDEESEWKYCPNCGCHMVETQESEVIK